MKPVYKAPPLGLPSWQAHIPIPNSERPPYEEGFPVLELPARGEDLMEGRQYELSPLARSYIDETWGMSLPRIIECLFKKRPSTRVATHTLNRETGEAKWSVLEDQGHPATFKAMTAQMKPFLFQLDLVWLAGREHETKDSHKVSAYEDKDFKSLSKRQQNDVLGISNATGRPKGSRSKSVASMLTEDNILSLLKL